MALRYSPLPAELYVKNRKKFCERILPKSVAVFNSNDIYPVSADSTLPFAQHRDIFYLCGVDQEESVLVLFPDAYHAKHREMLFLRKTNAHIAIWEGEKLSKEQAREQTGIQQVYWLEDLDKILSTILPEAEHIYLNKNEHYRADSQVETREDRFIKKIMAQFPLHNYCRSNPILQHLRSVKEPEEIQRIQQACSITEKGFRRALNFVKPGVMEYQIEAEFIHEFLQHGSRGFAYTPIVASGANSNVLHYIENSRECKSGDIILLDVGAEYGNYSSDMTRCIPVSGRFSPRQKEVYQAVLDVKNFAAKQLIPGNNWYDYHQQVGEFMTEKLLQLRLLTQDEVNNQDPEWPAYKKYFMHGTSHHLGLDTHDYGLLQQPFEAGMVFTVEPGIYLPEEGFGIRLEDNYVVNNHGFPTNLMANIPIEAEEIEALMNQ